MWFITVFEKLGEVYENGFPNLGSQRTWCYYKERETAVHALHENWTDMFEYFYEYAVIEYIEEGFISFADNRQWFKWDFEREGYFEIEEPECVKYFVNFALG
jgi:hypothetical protein